MGDRIVAVTDHIFPDLEHERHILEPLGFKLHVAQCTSPAEVIALSREAVAVLTTFAPLTEEVIEALPACKIIVRYGIGVDNVDVAAATRCRIPVVNVPDYGVQEVADHTFALLLSSVRKLTKIVEAVRAGDWQGAPCRPIMGLQGKTLGLAGFGNVAQAVAARARAFGMRVQASDPYVDAAEFHRLGVEKADWPTLLGTSDMLSVHLPLTKETSRLLNKQAFRLMKPSAHLINTSRGGVIDETDLHEALLSGALAGAALDVLAQEPVPPYHPLLALSNCLITSHCAWYSEDSLIRLQRFAAEEIRRLFTGTEPKHIVNRKALQMQSQRTAE